MSTHLKVSLRLVAALAVAGVVLAGGGWASASGGASTPSGAASTGTAGTVPATTVPAATAPAPGANAATGSAVWCCPSDGGQGLTVTGQATIRGRGTTARDAAIAKAVADATDQAKAAASAAGIMLGKIVDMQVSTWPDSYPIPVYAGAGSSGGGVAPASGAVGSTTCIGANCPANAECLCSQQRTPQQESASVTITWAIG